MELVSLLIIIQYYSWKRMKKNVQPKHVGTTYRCQVNYDDAHIGSHKVMLSCNPYYSLTYRLQSELWNIMHYARIWICLCDSFVSRSVADREQVSSYMINPPKQGCTNPQPQVARVTKFCTMMFKLWIRNYWGPKNRVNIFPAQSKRTFTIYRSWYKGQC